MCEECLVTDTETLKERERERERVRERDRVKERECTCVFIYITIMSCWSLLTGHHRIIIHHLSIIYLSIRDLDGTGRDTQ